MGRGAEPGPGQPRSPGCRALRVHARPGRAGRRGPDRHSHRPPAGPARSSRPGLRAAAGARAGRTRPAGRAVPGVPPRCVRPARARDGIGGQHGCSPADMVGKSTSGRDFLHGDRTE
jgi:hypothetical protein